MGKRKEPVESDSEEDAESSFYVGKLLYLRKMAPFQQPSRIYPKRLSREQGSLKEANLYECLCILLERLPLTLGFGRNTASRYLSASTEAPSLWLIAKDIVVVVPRHR